MVTTSEDTSALRAVRISLLLTGANPAVMEIVRDVRSSFMVEVYQKPVYSMRCDDFITTLKSTGYRTISQT